MKRLISLLVSAALTATIALMVTATPVFAAGAAGACDTFGGINDHVGVLDSPSSALDEVVGIDATITGPYDLDPCTGFDADNIHGPSAWVGIEGNGTSDKNIVQVGITQCTENSGPSDSPCLGSKAGTKRYFWAAGTDCYGVTDPLPHDLGPADDINGSEYEVVWATGSHEIRFYIYGPTSEHYYAISDSFYTCWLDDAYNRYIVSGERWDHNDGIGTEAYHMTFRGMQYKLHNKSWSATAFTDGNCFSEAPELKCNVSNSNGQNGSIWTLDGN